MCFDEHTTCYDTSPGAPPPSLQMRVGGGVFSLYSSHHHSSPLPRFKCESEGAFLVFTHHTTTRLPSLASNASRRGRFNSRQHPFPLPRFKCESEGAFLVFTHHTTTCPPSLASNASRPTSPPIPPPSLQTRVGGGCFNPSPTTFPLPRFKCESEGGVLSVNLPRHHPSPSLTSNVSRRGCLLTTSPPVPPPLLQMRVGGGVLSVNLPHHHLFPFLASHASRRGFYSPHHHHPFPPPSLQTRVGGVFLILQN
jgi:hypothetical protein